VTQQYAGFYLVDVLAAFAARAHGANFDILISDLDLDFIVHFGCGIDGGKRSVAFSCGVEGGDAHEAVDSAFIFQEAEGVFATDFHGS